MNSGMLKSRLNQQDIFNIMNKYFLFIFLLLSSYLSQAQNNKYKSYLKAANNEYKNYRYTYAIPIYKNYLQYKFNDTSSLIKLSNCYKFLSQYDSALKYMRMAFKNGAKTHLELSELFAYNKMYDSAVLVYKTFPDSSRTKLIDDRISGFNNIYQFISDSLDFKIYTTILNTPYNDFNPTPYKDGIVFESNRYVSIKKTKRFFRKNEFTWDGAAYSSLFYYPNRDSLRSNLIPEYKWNEKRKPKNLSDFSAQTSNDNDKLSFGYDYILKDSVKNYNQNVFPFAKELKGKFNMGAVSFTSDGLKAYYTRNQKKSNGVVQLEIWESNYKEGKWLKGHKMFFNNKNYSYFHPAITPDGKRLYYVSDEPTGWGGTDIYYIDRNDDGSWKATTNAGQDINTTGNELFPTFYNDLFCFSSNGHAGLGGLDIFRLENDKNGDFVIQNMGYPINSSKDDLAFSLNESKGYFSSNRMGSDDIYSFDYTKTFIDLSGQILTGFKLMSNAKVYLFEINVHGQKVLIDSAVLDDKSNYNFKIRPNKNLQIEVNDAYGKPHSLDINSENYILHNGQYHKEIALLNLPIPEEQLRADKLKQDEIKNAELSKMSKVFIRTIDSLKSLTNDYVELHHPFDQVYIIKEDLNDYYKLIERVKRMSNKKIIIVSAADCNGTLDYNEDLSTRRAKRIYKTLSSLSDNQIIIKEVGERELLKACDDLQKDINEQVVNRYSYIFILNK